MREHVLRILKGSRRTGRCSQCQQRVTWATCAPRGRGVPLVETPRVLREETNARAVVFEVIAGDQVHHCTRKRARAPRLTPASDAAVRARVKSRQQHHAYAAFTPDRLAELRKRIEGSK